jgi:hypothetical protein
MAMDDVRFMAELAVRVTDGDQRIAIQRVIDAAGVSSSDRRESEHSKELQFTGELAYLTIEEKIMRILAASAEPVRPVYAASVIGCATQTAAAIMVRMAKAGKITRVRTGRYTLPA